MKFFFLFLTLAICFFTNGQPKASSVKTYISNYQVDEASVTASTANFKIIIDETKLSAETNGYGYIKFIQQNEVLMNLKTKYWKTTKDEGGTTKWFNLFGSAKFNILRITNYQKPQNVKGEVYKSIVILSNYDADGTRLNDLGFLSNQIN